MNCTHDHHLENEIELLGGAISASEPWADNYRKSPTTWKKLITRERRLERLLRKYFREFSEFRVIQMVRWDLYAEQAFKMAEVEVVVDINDAKWEFENHIVLELVYDDVVQTISIGAAAGEILYDIPLGVSETNELIQKEAKTYVADMVKGITQTTRNRIRSSIEASIEVGENQEAAVTRLRKYIRNPKRADLIARTEAVRAYGRGQQLFATKAGAKSKTWQAIYDACPICADLDNKTVGVKKPFNSSIGSIEHAPAHPRCRCDVIYNFE